MHSKMEIPKIQTEAACDASRERQRNGLLGGSSNELYSLCLLEELNCQLENRATRGDLITCYSAGSTALPAELLCAAGSTVITSAEGNRTHPSDFRQHLLTLIPQNAEGITSAPKGLFANIPGGQQSPGKLHCLPCMYPALRDQERPTGRWSD